MLKKHYFKSVQSIGNLQSTISSTLFGKTTYPKSGLRVILYLYTAFLLLNLVVFYKRQLNRLNRVLLCNVI